MAISENRIETEKLVQAENEGGDGLSSPPDLSSLKQVTPEGMIKNLPQSIGQYSSFKELTSAVQSITSMAKGAINDLFTVPNIDTILNSIGGGGLGGGGYNSNQNVVNTALGIVKAALCGDSDALVFDLSAIIRALDYDFDFMRSFNICGRQGMRNPIDTLLKGIDNLEYQSRLLSGVGPRFLNNLKHATKSLISNLNLPKSLETCLNQKAILQGSSNFGAGISLGRLRDLLESTRPDICKSSVAGVKSNNYTVRKVAAQPFVTGISTYDRTTMYSFYSGVISSNAIEKAILLEILSEAFTDTPNSNSTKLLEMVAFTKVSEIMTDTSNPTSIGGINKVLHNYSDSENLVLDNILQAAEASKTVKASQMTNIKQNYVQDQSTANNFDATSILETMTDDLASETKDPTKSFNDTIKLLNIADPTFTPDDSANKLSSCPTTRDLSVKAMRVSKLPPLTSTTFNKGTNTYLRVTDSVDLIHVVGSMSDEIIYTDETYSINF